MIKRIICVIMMLAVCLSAAGCRSRVMPEGYIAEGEPQKEIKAEAPPPPPPEEEKEEEPEPPSEEEKKEEEPPEITQPPEKTEDNPQSDRKEYSEDADALAVSGAENKIAEPPAEPESEPEAPEICPAEKSGTEGNIITGEGAEYEIKEVVPDDNAQDLAADEQGEKAESVSQYYGALLQSRLGNLFECQRHYIYWETPEDYKTVHKSSAEHTLILSAGGYSVSAKLLEENLTVDDGWVSRKNPGAVVKCVSSDILGEGIGSDSAAASVRDSIKHRAGWESLDAVQNNRVIILSESLLDTPAGCTAAAVYIACGLYPDEFSDVDPDEALKALTKEEGNEYSGIYALWK